VQAGEEADLRIVERGAVRLEADPLLHGDRHGADGDGADRSSPPERSDGSFEYGPGGESQAVTLVRSSVPPLLLPRVWRRMHC